MSAPTLSVPSTPRMAPTTPTNTPASSPTARSVPTLSLDFEALTAALAANKENVSPTTTPTKRGKKLEKGGKSRSSFSSLMKTPEAMPSAMMMRRKDLTRRARSSSSSSSPGRGAMAMEIDLDDVYAMNAADIRARELTESPLADLSEAFLPLRLEA